jgi:hypothetical protein
VDAGVVISVLALAFTVFSFWWIQVRTGHLVAYEPQTYAGYLKQNGFRLRLPLTIYDTGAKALVATDLRVLFIREKVAVPVISFRSQLRPESTEHTDFAHPFAVPGRGSVSRFVEFGRKDWSPDPATVYETVIEVRTDGDATWRELCQVTLTSAPADTAGNYITYRRDPTDDAPPPSVWRESN